MNKFAMLCVILLCLGACGKPKIIYKDRPVEVAVLVVEPYQRPPAIEALPTLPVDLLTKEDRGDHDKITKAFGITVKMLEGKLGECKAALEPYYSPFNKE